MKIKKYNFETKQEEVEAEVSTYSIGKSASGTELAEIIANFCNGNGRDDYREVAVQITDHTHRALQQEVYNVVEELIKAWATQTSFDDRNKYAVEKSKEFDKILYGPNALHNYVSADYRVRGLINDILYLAQELEEAGNKIPAHIRKDLVPALKDKAANFA